VGKTWRKSDLHNTIISTMTPSRMPISETVISGLKRAKRLIHAPIIPRRRAGAKKAVPFTEKLIPAMRSEKTNRIAAMKIPINAGINGEKTSRSSPIRSGANAASRDEPVLTHIMSIQQGYPLNTL
jgi:hypothetical protein